MARRRPPTVHGVAVVDKPAGVTSHDVVGQLRRRFGERRIGHAGTLDPSATGVLVVGVGHVTRLMRFITDGRKRYTGEVVLGTATASLDADGEVTATAPVPVVDQAAVEAVIAERFVGTFDQIPPMVSALKVDGKRLHELAREGIEIERAPRSVTVYDFGVTDVSDGVISVDVACSAGTYIRSLAADLGEALGTVAHLRNLRRIEVAPFTIDEAAPPDECELLPVIDAVRSMERLVVDESTAARVAVGGLLDRPEGEGPWAVVNQAGELLGVYESHRPGVIKPSVVIPTGS